MTSGTSISPGSERDSSMAIASHGPYQPDEGHRFNSNKLLLDPYAKELAGAFIPSDLHFGYQLNSARADLSLDRRDNAHVMPKAVVTSPSGSKRKAKRPEIAWEGHRHL